MHSDAPYSHLRLPCQNLALADPTPAKRTCLPACYSKPRGTVRARLCIGELTCKDSLHTGGYQLCTRAVLAVAARAPWHNRQGSKGGGKHGRCAPPDRPLLGPSHARQPPEQLKGARRSEGRRGQGATAPNAPAWGQHCGGQLRPLAVPPLPPSALRPRARNRSHLPWVSTCPTEPPHRAATVAAGTPATETATCSQRASPRPYGRPGPAQDAAVCYLPAYRRRCARRRPPRSRMVRTAGAPARTSRVRALRGPGSSSPHGAIHSPAGAAAAWSAPQGRPGLAVRPGAAPRGRRGGAAPAPCPPVADAVADCARALAAAVWARPT